MKQTFDSYRSTVKDYISRVGMSGKNCEMCGKGVTNPSFFYSTKKWGKVYCHACGTTIEYNDSHELNRIEEPLASADSPDESSPAKQGPSAESQWIKEEYGYMGGNHD